MKSKDQAVIEDIESRIAEAKSQKASDTVMLMFWSEINAMGAFGHFSPAEAERLSGLLDIDGKYREEKSLNTGVDWSE